MAINVSVNDDETRALLDTLPEDMFDNAKTILSRSLFNIQRTITGRLQNGPMFSRTGALARSIKFKTSGTKIDNLKGEVFTKSKYAPIHEVGGDINAIDKYVNVPGGPYLNIPLSYNKTAAGVMRKNARDVFQEGGYIGQSQRGNWIVFANDGLPMFVLKKSVTIPARLEMVKTAEDEIPTFLSNLRSELLDNI